jgi:hypothetical protein
VGQKSRFWFGSQEDYVLGFIELDEHGAEFKALNTLGGKVLSGSHGTYMNR